MTIYFDSTARKVRDFPMSEAERVARVELAACYRIFHHLGWTEMIFNHVTPRVPGPAKSAPARTYLRPWSAWSRRRTGPTAINGYA